MSRLTGSALLFFVLSGPVLVHAQDAPPEEADEVAEAPGAEPKGPAHPTPPDHVGFGAPRRVSPELEKRLEDARAQLGGKAWPAAAAILKEVQAGAEVEDTQVFLTADGVLFTSLSSAAAEVAAGLPPAERASLQRPGDLPPGEGEGSPAGATDLQGTCTTGRPDHAALDIAPEAEWKPGNFARWVHRLTNAREMRSGTPAKNAFYSVHPMQLVFHGALAFGRSHQDLVAFQRDTGEILWRVATDVPEAEQTASSANNAPFDSWRYFTDLGGWSLTVVPGEPALLLGLDRPGRGTTRDGKLSFGRNLLRAHDPGTGKLVWKRGGADDADAVLQGLTFAAAPTVADARGDLLVAPATSDTGFHVVALHRTGALAWTRRVYDYIPRSFELLDEAMAHGAGLAVSGGIILGSPGHGLVFALTTRGEVLWQRAYPSSVRGLPNSPRFAPGHPVLSAGKAIAAPFDGEVLLVCDARTGALAWSRRFQSGYQTLLGADRARVYTTNEEGLVTASSLADGSQAWVTEPLGRPSGRSLVTRNRVYLTAQGMVLVLDAATGAVISRSRLWDEHAPAPNPGGLALSGGNLFLAAPWGYARLESMDETVSSLETHELREKLLRKAVVAQSLGSSAVAYDHFKQALASAAEGAERERLRGAMLEVAQEAAASGRDLQFLERVLGEQDLFPKKDLRLGFLFQTAGLIASSAPGRAARLHEEILEGAAPGDLTTLQSGIVADLRVQASQALARLARGGGGVDVAASGEQAPALVSAALSSGSPTLRLLELGLGRAHSRASPLALASLARLSARVGDPTSATAQLDLLESVQPGLSRSSELASLRAELTPATTAARLLDFPAGAPWKKLFAGKAAGAELVSTAPGSDPVPGLLVARDDLLALLDREGKLLCRSPRSALSGLAEAREKLQLPYRETPLALCTGDRIFLASSVGLDELLLPAGGGAPRRRGWLELQHPLLARASAQPTQVPKNARNNAAQPASASTAAPANVAPLYALGQERCVALLPEGEIRVLERPSGRLMYRAPGAHEGAAGPPIVAGGLVAWLSPRTPGVNVHDPRTRTSLFCAAPASPWKAILVPGVAIVIDCPAGLQVRTLPVVSGIGVEPGGEARVLWRDATARGYPSLAHADARIVLASQAGGKIVARALVTGEVEWSAAFPEGASPVGVIELAAEPGARGDLLVAATRGPDIEQGRGLDTRRSSRGIDLVRLGPSGEVRWATRVTDDQIAWDARLDLITSRELLLFFHKKSNEWSTRGVAVDLASGTERALFKQGLETTVVPSPPAVSVTTSGVAVSSGGGVWTLYAP